MATALSVRGIVKKFGDFTALDHVSFDIEPGKFVTLLGPSGCGKTTLLRSIAGFLTPDEGEILFNDKVMNNVPPNKRKTAMCFQSYALFPHKSVYENIRFGLRMKKVPRAEQEERIQHAMEMVNLTGLGNRKPYELSGGQQQRVALARCIVVQPDILLFDEPLSNLDAKLREKVRVEIREVQRELGIMAIYVTHDQAEALAISDVIISMSNGVVRQIDHPRDIYDRPNSRFVADFIGTANLIAIEGGENGVVQTAIGKLRTSEPFLPDMGHASVCIRPEDIQVDVGQALQGEHNKITAHVKYAVYMGNALDLFVQVGNQELRCSVSKDYIIKEGEEIGLLIPAQKVHLVDGV